MFVCTVWLIGQSWPFSVNKSYYYYGVWTRCFSDHMIPYFADLFFYNIYNGYSVHQLYKGVDFIITIALYLLFSMFQTFLLLLSKSSRKVYQQSITVYSINMKGQAQIVTHTWLADRCASIQSEIVSPICQITTAVIYLHPDNYRLISR